MVISTVTDTVIRVFHARITFPQWRIVENFETIEPPTTKEAWKKAKVRNKYFVRETENLPLAREPRNREK